MQSYNCCSFKLILCKLVISQVNDASRQLQEEEDACTSIANSMKKLAGDSKRFKEMVENMENK